VAVAKARNMIYFNSSAVSPQDLPGVPVGTAATNRTISFGAQPLFPSGIDASQPGPFFQLYVNDVAHPCTQGSQPANPNQNGIVFFPGSEGLYRNGKLIGGLGVSGDGVEQDDFVTAGGAKGFEPAANIRADQVLIRGVRLPYLKFPRNPTQ
jgi:Haem-degrading